MAGVQHLLRKAALEKMSSPEQLDTAMRVTSPMSWVALGAIGSLILAAVVFSIVGWIPVKVHATGILLRGAQVQTVQVTEAGVIEAILVTEGEVVEEGQEVARLRLQEVEAEMEATGQRIAALEDQAAARGAETSILESGYRRQLHDLRVRRGDVQRLVERGLKTRNDVAAIDAQISGVQAQLVQAELGESQRANQIGEERRKLAQLAARLADGASVRSRSRGEVTAVLKASGQVIRPGERLLNLEDPDAPLHALLFVPFAEGKKVVPTMEVRISPSTVRPDEHGFMLGTIGEVSAQPVTPEEVRSTLNNDQLAQRFAQDTPFRVLAEPQTDPLTKSRFAWTSSDGPAHEIAGNTPCTAQIIIDRRRPISYVIPALRKAMGTGG